MKEFISFLKTKSNFKILIFSFIPLANLLLLRAVTFNSEHTYLSVKNSVIKMSKKERLVKK